MPTNCSRRLFFMPLIIAAIAALLALAVHALWNNVLTDILPVKTISYWQALGLLALTRILVGGFPKRGGGGWGGPRGRHAMMQHWQSLTPDQRENLRASFDHPNCCTFHRTNSPDTTPPQTNPTSTNA